MGCTSAFPLPLIQKSTKAYMRKKIDSKIEKRFVKIRKKIFQGSQDINSSGTSSSRQN